MNTNLRTKDLVFLAMLAALAFSSVYFIRIPVIPTATFLRYDVKDVIIVIGGLLYGPMAAFAVAFVVGILQMLAVSEYGVIGFIMTLLSTTTFVCTASWIYKVMKNQWGAVIGLASGCVLMTVVMLLWNYIMTPIYMGVPRQVVASMLIPVFLPFNLITSMLNSAIVLIIFKPVMKALRLADPNFNSTFQIEEKKHFSIGVVLVSTLTVILLILIMRGII